MEPDKLIFEEREPRFAALIPFFVFVGFYLGLSLWAGDFYLVPMPVAFIVASASALALNHRQPLAHRVEVYARGMGDSNIMIMCMVFILAGAFAATAKATGAVEATVIIARHLVPDNLILVGIFLVASFISLAIGTSCGTIAALTPIAIGLIDGAGVPSAVTIGAVVGGAMFGDNMSMISDTTIAATRTQNVTMRDKFLMNLKMILPAALAAVVIYLVLGRHGRACGNLPEVGWRHILAMLPYLGILVGALAGVNVMALLFFGTVLSLVIGLTTSENASFYALLSEVGKGALNMSETLVVALLAGGLLSVIRHNGGISYLLAGIEKAANSRKKSELGIALLVGVVNLFTANNTVAIVIAGPIAKAMSKRHRCDPRRIASILDTASCAVQGIIPYGAQVLIAVGIAHASSLELSPLALMISLYYPALLGLALIVSIAVARNSQN